MSDESDDNKSNLVTGEASQKYPLQPERKVFEKKTEREKEASIKNDEETWFRKALRRTCCV